MHKIPDLMSDRVSVLPSFQSVLVRDWLADEKSVQGREAITSALDPL